MNKSIENALHLGVDFWKAKLLRGYEKSKKIKLSQRLTEKSIEKVHKRVQGKGGVFSAVVGGGVNPSPEG